MYKRQFTGSTDVGRLIRKATAGSGKKLSLELGGKSPFIVHEDADLDAAVEGVVDAIWFNQGQVCCAGSRLLVQEGIAGKFLAKLKRRMETLRVGNPLDKSFDMGAIVDPIQLNRINELVAKGKAEGGTLIQSSRELPVKGSFFAPSLFTDADGEPCVVFWMRGIADTDGAWTGAHSVPYRVRIAGDTVVADVMTCAAQALADDARAVARAEPPALEARGERHHVLVAECALELRQRAECETQTVSYTHLRAHENVLELVCRLLLEKNKKNNPEYNPKWFNLQHKHL